MELGYESAVCTSYQDGARGASLLAEKLMMLCEEAIDYRPLYSLEDSIISKIEKVCKEIYHAKEVVIDNNIKEKLNYLETLGFGNLPVCIAKTQYSFSDNPKLLGNPKDFSMHVTDVRLASGAGFIVILMGNIMTMPGLGKISAYLGMDIDKDSNITGLY